MTAVASVDRKCLQCSLLHRIMVLTKLKRTNIMFVIDNETK